MDLSRLAVKILERVRDFRSNFEWKKPKKVTKSPRQVTKVFHRQPAKQAASKANTPLKTASNSASKRKSSRGRKTVKK